MEREDSPWSEFGIFDSLQSIDQKDIDKFIEKYLKPGSELLILVSQCYLEIDALAWLQSSFVVIVSLTQQLLLIWIGIMSMGLC